MFSYKPVEMPSFERQLLYFFEDMRTPGELAINVKDEVFGVVLSGYSL
jgi:hypothetical protein